MSSSPDDRTVRRTAVVYGVGTTGKTVDNWLQRGQVTLPSGPNTPGTWRGFAAADVAVLALVQRIVEFGLPVALASDFANRALKEAAGARLPDLASAPKDSIKELGAGLRLAVWRGSKDRIWRMRVVQAGEESPPLSDAYLVVDLHRVLHRAIRRAFGLDALMDRLKARSTRSNRKLMGTRRAPVQPKPD